MPAGVCRPMQATDSQGAMVVVPVVVWPIEIHACNVHFLAAGSSVTLLAVASFTGLFRT